MGMISWADQSCAGKGSGSLSRKLATAQPEGCRVVLLINGGNGGPTCLALVLPEPDRSAGITSSPCWLAGSDGDGAVTDPAQRFCLISTTTAMALTSPQGDRQRWNGGGGNAPSSSAPPPRRPAIFCAIETDARRQGRPWWRALSDRPLGIRGWSDSNLADQRCTLLPLLPQLVAAELIGALTL